MSTKRVPAFNKRTLIRSKWPRCDNWTRTMELQITRLEFISFVWLWPHGLALTLIWLWVIRLKTNSNISLSRFCCAPLSHVLANVFNLVSKFKIQDNQMMSENNKKNNYSKVSSSNLWKKCGNCKKNVFDVDCSVFFILDIKSQFHSTSELRVNRE